MNTHYDILGVSPDASMADIKAAYRYMAKALHPDKAGGDPAAEEQFKALSAAYRILSNPLRRRHYDATLKIKNPTPENIIAAIKDIAWGVFENITGRKHSLERHHGMAGRDHNYTLTIDLPLAMLGGETSLDVAISGLCETCHGTGTAPGSIQKPCQPCRATGEIRFHQGLFTMRKQCTVCRGQGRVTMAPCISCEGHGRIPRTTTMRVKVPKNTRYGTVLRYAGLGTPGPQGTCGDLRVTIHINAHPFFDRRTDGIHCTVPITFTQAALGATLDVPCITGEMRTIQIQPGTQSGTVLSLHNPPCDIPHKIRLQIETPQAADPQLREILESLKNMEQNLVGYPRVNNFKKSSLERGRPAKQNH